MNPEDWETYWRTCHMTTIKKLSFLAANMREVASDLATMSEEGVKHAAELRHAAGLVDQWVEAIEDDLLGELAEKMMRESIPSDFTTYNGETHEP